MSAKTASCFESIGGGLFRFVDTCTVYVLVRAGAALAIDLGSGAWLGRLDEIGAKRLEWVLLTHTHRDQCAGVYRLDRTVTKLAVPAAEKHLVDDVESFWRRRETHHNYNQVSDFFSLPRNVPLDLVLEDYARFEWRGVELEVLPAPGHTPGSTAFVGELGGTRVAFVGDLIDGSGHAPQIHNLQYGYTDALGAELALHSLKLLSRQSLELLCPGHGDPIVEPSTVIESYGTRLETLCREMYHIPETRPHGEFIEVSPHLLESAGSCCTWYVLRSDDGHALLIDLGYQTSAHAVPHAFGYLVRFLPLQLEALFEEHSIRTIDAILISHYHDDHIIGVPYLQKRWSTPVWCLDRIAPVLREPDRFNVPCLMPWPIDVARTFGDRECFEWRGVELQMHDLPGQTDLHSGISFEVDGKRYLAMGDSAHFHDGRLAHGHIIFANRVSARNHLQVAERMLEIEPEVLLHGHHRRQVELADGSLQGRGDTPVKRGDLVDFEMSARRLAQVLESVVGDSPERRCRADWVRIEPYRVLVDTGESVVIETLCENVEAHAIDVELALILPDGVTADPIKVSVRVAPGKTERRKHILYIDRIDTLGPTIVCVDVTLDGEPLGWLTECQLWHGGTPR